MQETEAVAEVSETLTTDDAVGQTVPSHYELQRRGARTASVVAVHKTGARSTVIRDGIKACRRRGYELAEAQNVALYDCT